jgi:hypothetical protein
MITFQFPASKVKAALIFAAVQDIRYYLNGVLFTKAPDGKGILAVSTDGHRLAAVYHAQDDVSQLPDFAVIVPRDELATAAKNPIKSHGELDLVFMVEQTTDETGIITTVEIRGAVSLKCGAVEGKYPDYQRVIPRTFGTIDSRTPQETEAGAATYGCIDATYLGDYAKVAKALGGRYTGISFTQGAGGSAFLVNLFGQPDFVSVVMAMRGDAPVVPGWLDAPVADNVVELRKAA